MGVAALALAAMTALTACGTDNTAEGTDKPTDGTESSAPAGPKEITIETANGPVTLMTLPKRVAALDNSSMLTVKAFGITPVALPKKLLADGGDFDDWENDKNIADVGTHKEPNLEVLNEAAPDLIIGGQRFTDFQKDLEKIATTIDISPDDESKDGYVEGLKTQTTILGQIFGQEDKAAQLVKDLDAAAAETAAKTTGQKVFLAAVSGGKVDNGASRIGRLLEPLKLKNVLDPNDASITAVHNDSGLAPETIAELDPEFVIVMDRDAATGKGTPAKELIESNQAFANTTFMKEGNIVYLAPTFYSDEGIQAYTVAYKQITEMLSK
jgi:iron complex transport system substrate-binding protein